MMLLLSMSLILCLNLYNVAEAESSSLRTAKQWQLFTYNFLPLAPINDLNFYNPSNVLATGVAVGYDRIFIATPKLFSGVPSTVNFVSKAEFGDSPVLQAYPDWSFSITARKDFNCSDLILVSVYRMRMDSCNRLWVLDAGVSRSLEDYEITCPPKILIIDLNTDQVVRRVDFPREILRGESLFTNLVIDETTAKTGTCDDVYAYITDTVEPAIIVYDSERDVTWRVSHPAMYPDPDYAQSEILNDRFILMDGVVGLTFDPKLGVIYFQPLATDRVFSVSKNALRAGPLAQNEVLQVKLVGKKSSQGIGLAVSPIDSSLIFSPISETAIASWNPSINRQSVLAYDRDRLQFVADITTTPYEPGIIYAVSSKFHRFFLKSLNEHEVNNRILRLELPNAVSSYNAVHSISSPYPFFSNFYKANILGKSSDNDPDGIIPSPLSDYFTSNPADAAIRRHRPYKYETVGVINYSLSNPFTALNQGESFAPKKEQKSPVQVSFLDTLANNDADTVTLPSTSQSRGTSTYNGLHTNVPLGRGYRFGRHFPSTPIPQQLTPTLH